MNNERHDEPKQKGGWLSGFLLSVVHLLAFGMLYLVLVQINWAFQDFYKLVGTKLTPAFERIALISDYIAAYTPLVLLVIALDIFVIWRLACRGSRWMSAYSHAVLLCVGFTGFLWTARSIEPMAWGLADGADPPAIKDAQAVYTSEPTMGLRQDGEPSDETARRWPSDLVARNSIPDAR